ncbi:hypothetical protein [Phaeocystidibacter luteus]|uniref:Lipoprotein n=1 Tax=Phaeocystidibacter luteus TaxID=911197 RepID=A0A6N6RGK9_9FLAO|nr:hypothetical protein [Phaeocystidibacter luteus]KAB2807703.1 hypothetical protein F8C67_11725 [Phaeocystidibacter luteus]
MKYVYSLIIATSLFSCTTKSTRPTEPTTPTMLGYDNLQKTIIIRSDEPIDLATCIEEHSYPPHLNQDIYWNLPDTSDWGYNAKSTIAIKHSFDSIGRLGEYYYRGSLISGEYPLSYKIEYATQGSDVIVRFEDIFNREEYLVDYFKDGGVKQIQKRDSTGRVVEVLAVQPIN